MNALGSIGGNFLRNAGGSLLKGAKSAASGLLNRITGHFTNMLGGGEAKKLGKTTTEHLYDKAFGAAYGGLQKFANSDFIRRKIPIIAPALQDVASEFKSRLQDGY